MALALPCSSVHVWGQSWIVFGIGQTLTAVGVVAVGVTVGTRRAAYLRQFDQQ